MESEDSAFCVAVALFLLFCTGVALMQHKEEMAKIELESMRQMTPFVGPEVPGLP